MWGQRNYSVCQSNIKNPTGSYLKPHVSHLGQFDGQNHGSGWGKNTGNERDKTSFRIMWDEWVNGRMNEWMTGKVKPFSVLMILSSFHLFIYGKDNNGIIG